MHEVVVARGSRYRAAVVVALVVVTLAGGLLAGAPRADAARPAVPGDTTAAYMVYDRTTGRVVESARSRERFRSASLVKLLIALDHLYARGSVANVTAENRRLIQSMLRSSDDRAASTLWVRGGYEQVVTRMVRRIGLTDTVAPTDRRYWGYTAVSAQDVVRTYNFVLDRAPSRFRDLIMGDLQRHTRCATDGFDQGFGLPRAIRGTKAVKQGWSGYGSRPAGPRCVEGSAYAPATAEAARADEAAPQAVADARPSTLATPSLDLSRRALHTSGVVDDRRRVIVVLTLSPRTKSFDAQARTVTDITRTLHANATATASRR